MYSEFFIAKRLYYSLANSGKRMSRPAVKVALAGIVIGIAVMIITLFVVIGFKQEVQRKVTGFGSHIQVVNFDNNNTYEMQPVCISDSLLSHLQHLKGVRSAHRFATKPGMVKTDCAFQGIVFKGQPLPSDTLTPPEWQFFAENLVEGHLPTQVNEVLVSEKLARLVGLQNGDAFFCYFVQENVRARKFKIAGLYNTDFADYDNYFLLGDIRQVQQLNGWSNQQVSGAELLLNDFSQLSEVSDRVYFATANQADADGNFFYTQNIIQLNPAIFSWLDLLNLNVVVIIFLMLCVSGFNIISGLIILILDAIQLIGTLKALGADNTYIRRIFLWQASFLVGKGMLWGNLLGLGLCTIQYFFHLLPLDPTAYYVSYVPIAFHWGWWALLNIGTFGLTMLVLLAPSVIITRISPAKVMHFE
ncbi:MAG: FtsX-like permease family protein [Paludibacter sp.]|nr:FtsX-like permease family protein [Bacteroidales bacterium]MCM1068914.1 FtsX-like permease family protein [Prevotella sp.]MCM1353175.1 FtsX-like permease family protein [Bacteroides sp.]MCM1442497.1 FtsX-like permease family protein [Muribaculum sp.]MCM1481340.1 FtsX-like permease family protein [Paludibacter sp.]